MKQSNPKPGDPAKNRVRKKFWFKRTPLAAGFIYFVAMGIAFLYVVPSLFHAERYKSFILKAISKTIETDISAGKIDFYLLGGPGIVLDNIVISKDESPIITIKQAKADINIWESLKGNLSIGELEAYDPVIRLKRMRDGSYNLPLLNTAKNSGTMVLGALLAIFERVTLDNATIEWVDHQVSLTPIKAFFSGIDLHLAKGGRTGQTMINLAGKLKSKGDTTAFNVSGALILLDRKISGKMDIGFSGRGSFGKVNIHSFWPYINPHVPFQKLDCILSWDGIFGGSLVSGFKSKGKVGLFDLGIRFREAFSKDVKPRDLFIDYTLSGNAHSLKIMGVRMRMGQIDLKAEGDISGLDTINPFINVTFSTNEMEVSDIKELIPYKVLTPQQSAFLQDNAKSGKVALRDFRFRGDLDKLRHLDDPHSLRAFTGALSLSGIRLVFQDLLFPLDDINGFISLKEDRLLLSNIKGRYGQSHIEEISGEVTGIHEWPDFNIRIIANLDLPEAQELLAMQVTSPELRWHIKELKDIKGAIRWDMVVAGNAEDPLKTLILNGKVMLDKVGFYHKSFGLPVYDLTGLMEMDLNDVHVDSMTWKAGSSPFEISGVLKDVLQENPSFDLTLLSDIFLDDIKKIRLITFGDVYDQSGQALVKVKLKGDFKEFEISQWLDATQARYRFEDLILKEKGVKNIYTFEGSVHNIETIEIDRLIVELGESKVVVTGEVDEFLRGQGLNLTFSTDGVLLNDLDRFLIPFQNIDGGGYIKGWFSIAKEKSDKRAYSPYRLDGKLIMDNADFKLPIFPAAFRGVDAQFDLIRGRIFLSNGKGTLGKGKFTVTGHGRLDEPPEFNLNVKADSLYLDDFIGKEQYSIPPENDEFEGEELSYLERGSWNIVGISKTGDISGITYEDLSTSILFQNDNFHISPFSFTAYGGLWRWDGDVALGEGKEILLDSVANIEDFSIEEYLKEGYNVEKQIRGKMNFKAKIKSTGENWEELKRRMQGTLNINAAEGVLHRFEVLSKIFSLLNVSQYFKLKVPDLSVDGLPYSGITASFTVKDGVATTDDLMVESEAMRLSAMGDYDIATGNVDMHVSAMPFVALDRVVSAIPIVGYVLAGENDSFIASHYLVTGSIRRANVEAIPLQSIAMGVAGILKRFIMLPEIAVEAISGTLEKPQSEKNEANE